MAQDWNYLDLQNIRATLIRQEDTILFNLIERAQFKRNAKAYEKGADFMAKAGIDKSFVDFMLFETESTHSKARRYTSPDEKPFTNRNELPASILPPLVVSDELKYLQAIEVNLNAQIYAKYSDQILPIITKEGDDGQYGSTAVCDIQALQALSKRIHYGCFVAESKFQSRPDDYRRLQQAGDKNGIMELLTNREVEDRVIKRVMAKAATYGQEITDETAVLHGPALSAEAVQKLKVNPESMGKLYRDIIIPLTKDVEVEYLMQRALL